MASHDVFLPTCARPWDAGKQVAVLVELKARFDEARNVDFAQKLESAGCNLAYGIKGVKTHSKATLVVRREKDASGEDMLRMYVHIGTGNYNPSTAGIYTDYGIFSCDPVLGRDVCNLFKYLTGHHYQEEFQRLLVAPHHMHQDFVQLIERETANALAGKEASIMCKMNGLDDRTICEALYRASEAGVQVSLVIRGICRIRPGVPGVSDNIRVVSIIGRFLEHHRVFRFENAGEPVHYMGSSDLMTRNLMRRVEVVVRVDDRKIKQEMQELLDACLSDQVLAWEMGADGRYHRTQAARRQAQNHKFSAPGKGKLARAAATVGLHTALMDDVARTQAGRLMPTGTPPTLNLLLLLRASV